MPSSYLKQDQSKTKCPVWSVGKRALKKLCINSQFGYCAQAWINRSRNQQKNRIHEKALRFVYNNKNSTLKELLTKEKSEV